MMGGGGGRGGGMMHGGGGGRGYGGGGFGGGGYGGGGYNGGMGFMGGRGHMNKGHHLIHLTTGLMPLYRKKIPLSVWRKVRDLVSTRKHAAVDTRSLSLRHTNQAI